MLMYNENRKNDYINYLIEGNKNYIHAYQRIFDLSKEVENSINKDLCEFNESDLMILYKINSASLKYTTVISYNSLIGGYKKWCSEQGFENTNLSICSVNQLDTIKNFKEYIIFTDETIDSLTKHAIIDGGGYNSLIFIRMFWETDAQVSVDELCKLSIENVDASKNELIFFNKHKNRMESFKVSSWLVNIIVDFANMEKVTFFNKRGEYYLGTAQENNGYVLRLTKSSRTNRDKVGMPLTPSRMSNVLNNFCNKNLNETITVSDLLMSLSIKHMLENEKSSDEMFREKRYFKNIPKEAYVRALNKYAPAYYSDKFEAYNNKMSQFTKQLII